MKILLTGSAGFIGFHTAKALCENDNEVIGIDNLNDYYDISLKQARLNQLEHLSNQILLIILKYKNYLKPKNLTMLFI